MGVVLWPTIFGFVQILLAFKLVEMLFHCFQAAAGEIGESVGGHVRWSVRRWIFTGRLARVKAPKPVRVVLGIAFRWTMLMALDSAGVMVSRAGADLPPAVLLCSCGLLLAGVWIEIFQRFAFRLRFGHGDTQLRASAERELERITGVRSGLYEHRRFAVMHDFVFLFARVFVVTVVSYAAFYAGINSLWPTLFDFHGISSVAAGIPDFLYFSLVTAATVGYGDVYPCTPWARLTVASEILCIFSIFVLLISAFSLTEAGISKGSKGTSRD